jgi:AcrR family transcriptional regulator
MDDIAREAGISPPLMRHYFGNRDGLLTALVKQGIEQIMEILTGPHHGGLEARLDAYLEFVHERPWAHRLWMAAATHDEALSPLVAAARMQLRQAAFGSEWDESDLDQRFRASAWIAVVEKSVDEWLTERGEPAADVAHRLVDIAGRLGIPHAQAGSR